MSVTNFIPQVWSARLLAHLDSAHVLTNLVNRDYEGEVIGYGDTVKITQIGDITVSDYQTNTDISDPEELSISDKLLLIDQQKYFNFQIDDVDNAQSSASLMDTAMQRSAYALNGSVDKWLAKLIVDNVDPTTSIGTDLAPIAIDKDSAYQNILKMKVMLDKANVPFEGRWLLVPPEFHGLLLSDARFVATGGEMAESNLANGFIGRAAGFNVFMSNNLPSYLGRYKMIASYNDSVSFVEQIIKTEAYRLEKRFADAVKGLHVYGAKVLRADKIVVLTAAFDCGIMQPIALKATAGTAGKTVVSANPIIEAGYSAKYKTGATVAMPQYDEVCTTGWTAFVNEAEIAATSGNELVVVYVDGANKAKAAGKALAVTE